MSFIRIQRYSPIPTIVKVWQAYDIDDETFITQADGGWNIIFVKEPKNTKILICTPSSLPTTVHSMRGKEVLGIQLEIGTFIRYLYAICIPNTVITITSENGKHFQFFGANFEIPHYENSEQFITKLTQNDILHSDSVVTGTLSGETLLESTRTIERHFKATTGMTYSYISQIIRAQKSAEALRTQLPLTQVAMDFGYADQSHMTRQFKHLLGFTPLQILKNVK
jgi:AraC-like DNA-binding protein